MGGVISAARAEVARLDEEAAKKAKQDLEILQTLMDSKLDAFENQLNEKILNPDGTSKTEVPGIRALRKTRVATVRQATTPAADIGGAVDSFFSIGNEGTSTGTAVKDGFKKVVSTALNVFVGNSEVGQHEERKYFVYMMHNAVVRLDVFLWRWNFSGKGFSDKYENALGYIICTSIVDVTVLRTSEFVFLISEYAGDSEAEVTKYCDSMEAVYNAARRVKLSQLQPMPVTQLDDGRGRSNGRVD